jgi:4-diphosphocytidyl-2C-methyl-D-erythritol kinase
LYYKYFQLWGIPEKLIQESWDFWKDIPFFFYENPCMIWENFWEQIKPVPFNENKFSGTPIYIYKPDFENCTKTMYKKLNIYENWHTNRFLKSLSLSDCWNTFDEFLKEPKYQDIPKWVDTNKIHLCGSGSSFFSFEKISSIDYKEIKAILS